jgi:hypothetical protein
MDSRQLEASLDEIARLGMIRIEADGPGFRSCEALKVYGQVG